MHQNILWEITTGIHNIFLIIHLKISYFSYFFLLYSLRVQGRGWNKGKVGSCFEKREYHLFSYYPFPVNRTWRRAVGNMGRLRHIRRAIARLDTSLKHLRCAKKSTPCFIQKASRRVADRTSKTTTTLFIFHFLYSTKILRDYHLYLFFISLVQWRKLHYIFIFFT